jgi:hypothetical protein
MRKGHSMSGREKEEEEERRTYHWRPHKLIKGPTRIGLNIDAAHINRSILLHTPSGYYRLVKRGNSAEWPNSGVKINDTYIYS